MKKNALFFSILFICQSVHGNPVITGPRGAALGNTSCCLEDSRSSVNNQAALGFIKHIHTGVFCENRFFLKELSTQNAFLIFPGKIANFGLSIQHYGYSAYNEKMYTLSSAKAFSTSFSIGMGISYLTTHTAEKNTSSCFVPEIGLQAKPMENLTIGTHLYNPSLSVFYKKTNEHLPTIFRVGIKYSFSSKVLLALETEKDISKKPLFKAGIEYGILHHFFIRGGISNEPVLTTFGFGFVLQHLQIDFSGNFHQTLGFSSQLGLTYTFQKKEKIDRAEL